MSVTGAIVAGVGAATSIGSAAIGANAAGNAANAQVGAANNAAQLQHQDAQAALNVNQQQYAQNQANLQPFLRGGTAAYANLLSLMGTLPPGGATRGSNPPGSSSKLLGGGQEGITASPGVLAAGGQQPAPQINGFDPIQGDNNSDMPVNAGRLDGGMQMFRPNGVSQGSNFALDASGNQSAPTPIDLNSQVNPALGAPGSLAQGWQGGQFVAPDNVTEQNDPGFQFRLAQGQRAIEQSAAARGGLLSGGTAKALNDYSQGQASNEYGNVYSRALGQYQQNYNQFEQQSTDKYNRLAALAGIGPQTAQQLGTLGNQSAGNATNILLTSGQQIGQDYNNAGAATASGYVGGANAWGNALSGIGNTASSLGLLSLLNKPANSQSNSNPWGGITF